MVLNIFSCAYLLSSLVVSIQNFWSYLKLLFFQCWVLSSLRILDFSLYLDICFHIFFLVISLSFHSFNSIFVQIINSFFIVHTFTVISKKSVLSQRWQRCSALISSRLFVTLGFIFRSMVNFGLILIYNMKYESKFISCMCIFNCFSTACSK